MHWSKRGDATKGILNVGFIENALVQLGKAAEAPILIIQGPVGARRAVWANAAASALWQIADTDIAGTDADELLCASGAHEAKAVMYDGCTCFHESQTIAFVAKVKRADGDLVDVVGTAMPLLPIGSESWIVNFQIASSNHIQAQLQVSHLRFNALAQYSPMPTLVSEVGVRLAHVNTAFTKLLSTRATNLLGVGWMSYIHPEDKPMVTDCLHMVLAGTAASAKIRMITETKDERLVQLMLAPVSMPDSGAGFVGTVEDITERAKLEKKLEYQATHDSLTNLPNRTQLLRYLSRIFGTKTDMALMFLDLDDFKIINDSLGHDVGDTLLAAVADRLQTCARGKNDIVARFGGDEFVLVYEGVNSPEVAQGLANRVLDVIGQPVVVASNVLKPSGSIGIVLRSVAHTDAKDMLRDADVAMYNAKRAGRGRGVVCDDSARQKAHEMLTLTTELDRAIDRHELTVAYQPIIHAGSAMICGAEALVRWRHPDLGDISPAVFVPLAEHHNLINRIDNYVLDTACAQLAEWFKELGPGAMRFINVNVSPLQLSNPDYPQTVAATLAKHGLSPSNLCLEITETALMQRYEICKENLQTLRDSGVRIAIDDFGTGYSSLSFLGQLPVTTIKIDRSFVSRLGQSKADGMCSAIIVLAKHFNLDVVAEGVESVEQQQILFGLGCQKNQGWLFHPAVSGAEFTALVAQQIGQSDITQIEDANTCL